VSAIGSGLNAGTYVTQASGNALNYNLTFVNGTLTIGKAALTVSGNSANTTYTGVAQNISGFNVSGLQGNDTVSVLTNVTASGANGTNAGSYVNTVTTGLETNYNVTGINGALYIAKATVTVAADSQTRLYGQNNAPLTQTMTGFVPGENASIANVTGSSSASTLASNVSGVGNYTITSSVGNLSAANYDFVAANGVLTVNKAHLTVTADDQSRIYGSANPTFTQTITGFVNGETAVTANIVGTALGTSSANATTNVGTYSITGTTGGLAAANYDFVAANGTLTINKAQLSAIGLKTYDGSSSILGGNLTVSGVNGETFIATGAATMQTKNVQTNQTLSSLNGLSLTGVNGSSLGNYELLNVANTSVSVTPLNVTLVAPNATKSYDGTAVQLATASDLTALSAQLVGGDRVSAATITYSDKNAGANKTVTIDRGSLKISDDNNGLNYNVSVADASGGVINKANLTVAVVNDLKFVTQNDLGGSINVTIPTNTVIPYAGVVYNGLVAGETSSVLGVGSITRTNLANNAVGNYTGVLVASGWTAANYNISYQAGNYTIVGADTLAIKATNTAAVYGSTPSYNLTAQYLHNGTVFAAPNITLNGNTVSVVDGAGGSATFALNAVNGCLSSSGNLQVGGYNLDAANVSITGNNFNSMVVAGAVTITPKTLSNNLGIQSISKVYDGSTSITAANFSLNSATAGVLGNDTVGLIGSGTYADRNVGANKSVTLSMGLTGKDALNYALSTNSLTANVGEITQLSCVTYVGGNTSGNWSSASNWAGGAIPDGHNVANVIIPTNASVVYNSDQVGTTSSNISNSGNIIFASANPFNLTNTLTGSGTITQRGVGNLTISGNNSISGLIDIASYNLTLANANAAGTATIVSSGGNLSVAPNIALSSLSTSGNITLGTAANITNNFTANGYVNALSSITTGGNLIANNGISVASTTNVAGNVVVSGLANLSGNISVGGDLTINGISTLSGFVNTVGNQTYNGSLTFLSSGTPSTSNTTAIANFYSSAGNISFDGMVSAGLGSAAAQRDLVVSASNGTILFNDQVGQAVTNVQNGTTQFIPYSNYSQANFSPYALDVNAKNIRLNGDVNTFVSQQYTGSVAIGGNGSNGNIRLLLSMDPSIVVNGDINGVIAGQNSLVLAALNLPGESTNSTIQTGNIGLITPLANLKTIQGEQKTNTTGNQTPLVADLSFPTGQLNLNGSVNTIGNQTYTASNIALAGANTLTSQNGTIEMITAFDGSISNGSISGLGNTTFALGSAANLGNNLANLHPANIYHIPDPPPPYVPSVVAPVAQITPTNLTDSNQNKVTLLAQNTPSSTQYAVNMVQAQQTIQSMMSTASEIAMSGGDVSVSMGDTVTRPGSTSLRDASDAICVPVEGNTCAGK
jgi:MBG domain (YGX type)/YDG domain